MRCPSSRSCTSCQSFPTLILLPTSLNITCLLSWGIIRLIVFGQIPAQPKHRMCFKTYTCAELWSVNIVLNHIELTAHSLKSRHAKLIIHILVLVLWDYADKNMLTQAETWDTDEITNRTKCNHPSIRISNAFFHNLVWIITDLYLSVIILSSVTIVWWNNACSSKHCLSLS